MNSIQQLLERQKQMPKELHNPATDLIGEGVPTCGADLKSPVVDPVRFAEMHSYRIGGRLFVENADGGGMPEA